MQHQARVQHPGDRGGRLAAEQHPVEIGGVGQVFTRRDGFVTMAEPMEGRHDRGQLGHQADHRIPIGLGVGHIPRRVEHAQAGHRGLQRSHRVARFRHAFDHVHQLVLQPAVLLQLLVEQRQFFLGGQLTLQEQPRGLLEGAFAGKGFHGDAAVLQPSALAVNETDRRFGHWHIRQARTVLRLAHHHPQQISASLCSVSG